MATWVVGDIHGCYDDFMKLLNNKEIKTEDTIILIGDIVDRGPDSYKMIKWAMNNITENGKYQMILGNHEDELIWGYQITLDWNKNKEFIDIAHYQCNYDFSLYMYEAGYESVYDVKPIIDWFNNLPIYKRLTVNNQEYLIAHAWFLNTYDINLNNRHVKDKIVWERDITYSGQLTKDYTPINNEILIHGHTPTISIIDCQNKELNEVLFREHSINIDCGCVFKEYGGNLAAIRLEDQKVIYANPQQKIKMP